MGGAAPSRRGRANTVMLSPMAHAQQLSSPTTILGKRRSYDDGAEASSCIPLRRLPAKTSLFCCVPRAADPANLAAAGSSGISISGSGSSTAPLPEQMAGCLFSLAAPSPSAGMRVCEYMLTRPAMLASRQPTCEDALRQLGCEGWMLGDGGGGGASDAVVLAAPGDLLRLVDDDKQAGLAQAFLTDMFARGGGGGSSRGPRR